MLRPKSLWTACLFLAVLFCALSAPRRLRAEVPDGFVLSQYGGAFGDATAMAFAPDGRLFICQQDGKLRVVKNGQLLAEPFLSLAVDSGGERGLLGVAFDPNFETQPYVYVYYTVPGNPPHNRVSRFLASGDAAVPDSEEVLLDLDDLSASNHNGGAIHFGPDGYLYIAVGENAVPTNSQKTTNLLGKMLRMAPDGSIPADNPFFNTAADKNRLIWALGLRNPFTFAFQPGTGRMFINDVGQNTWEEVNEGAAGANYGWPKQEGPAGPNDPAMTRPLFAYKHDDAVLGGCAISGAAFYNPSSPRFPSGYIGRYFFADFCGGYVASFNPANPSGTVAKVATGLSWPVDLQVGPDGALYILLQGGRVQRLDYTADAPPLITAEPESKTVAVGQPAIFMVSASGATPLQYQWERDGQPIPNSDSPTYTLQDPQLADSGAQFRVRVTNSFGEDLSQVATLTVVSNTPPTAAILTPSAGALYQGGQTLAFSGSGTDPEEGSLPASAFTWKIDFHHADHHHPFVPSTSGFKSGNFTVPTTGETATDVWYRLHLTVTDSGGQSTTVFRDIQPRTSTLTLQTSPPGLELTLDGQPVATPSSVEGVVGIQRELGAAATQQVGGRTYQFAGWSDGGAATHTVSTPLADTTYTAFYALAEGAPVNLQAAVRSAVRVDLTWDDQSSEESGFLVERRAGDGPWQTLGQPGTDAESFTDTSAAPSTRYRYRVRAVVEGAQTLPSNEVEVTTPAAGKLVLSASRLNFGRVRKGAVRTLRLTLTNRGSGPLPVTVGGVSAPFGATPQSFTLQRNQKQKISVTFSPTASGSASGKLPISSDDPARRTVSVTLTGRGK